MAVGFQVKFLWFSVGTGDFLHSFFSTICVRLENSDWGSRFPVLMRELYAGSVAVEQLPVLQSEVAVIAQELREHLPAAVVWDAADLSLQPPWGDEISADIRTLADYHVTNDGKNLLEVLNRAIGKGLSLNAALTIREL